MALFIVSREIRLHVEAPNAHTAKEIAYDVLEPGELDAYEADENDIVCDDPHCRPWARDERGGVKLSPRTCGDIVEASARERERLEQEREATEVAS